MNGPWPTAIPGQVLAGLWEPVLPATALTAIGYVVGVLGGRLLRHRRLHRDARRVEILAPPEATLDSAHAFWTHTIGLLRPRWRRPFDQPHLAWEYTATAAGIRIHIWVPGAVPPGVVERAIAAAWPGATTRTRPDAPSLETGAAQTGGWLRLARGDEYPLRTRFTDDPLRALLGAVTDLDPDQQVSVRVCARPATGRRTARARQAAAHIRRSTGSAALLLDALAPHPARTPGHTWPDAGDNIRQILTKAASPRLACHISYLLSTGTSTEQARERLRGRAAGVAGAFAAFSSGTNHLRRVRMWKSRMWARHRYLARGYLLSVPELAAIAHLPTDACVPGLARAGARRITPSPAIPSGGEHTRLLGEADTGAARGIAVGVAESRQHTHVLGKTGSGKSTLIANLVLQDAQAGRAALVIDPRGDLITDVLARLPEKAVDRVVLFDPDDNAPPPRLNLLHGGDPDVTSDTVTGIFHRIYAQWWGPRTDDILRAATLTLTRARDPRLTLGHIPRLLTDDAFRRGLTAGRRRDEALNDFWDWYSGLSLSARSAATGPVLNKLRTALLRPWVRQVIASGPSTIDLSELFDTGGLVLMRLPKGRLGEDTSSLIGSFALAATWQTVTARVHQQEQRRADVAAYIDECHNFLNMPGSLADMLAEARGYHLGLTLAHQELGQLPGDLRKALSANARTKIYFTCSPDDAAQLEDHTLPSLRAYDLTHLGAYQAAVRPLVGAKEQPAATLRTRPLAPLIPGRATQVRTAARRHAPSSPAAELVHDDR